ncbi:MAG: carbohydrate-binding protein [Phormidesmis sp. CAN_BIN36]|nr:carbohydrate-binding protein [Phormidesmis sp. CAN_BIN36]
MSLNQPWREQTEAGIKALQSFYNTSTGLWNTAGWWNSANALETTIDYCRLTDSLTYRSNLSNTFEKNKRNNFLNEFYDDEGWWALTWIKAYDLTGEQRYLNMAKTIFNDMKGGWDSTCGGGIWWSKQRKYKNAIANELFLAIAAKLHLRTSGDTGAGSYLDWAQREWNWFRNTGMINRDNLINDGLDNNCKNNGQLTWTYNQGVILGGLVDLYRSTQDAALLNQARAIADAAIRVLAPNGILREPCEPDCGQDGPQFKGIFVRYLGDLYQATQQSTYKDFILRNADSIWSNCRNNANQFGLCWANAFDSADAVRQSSAIDALNASLVVTTEDTTYQAENGILHQLAIEAIHSGYHGSGYIAGWNREGQWVDFKVNAASTGSYTLTFRYAAAGGNASRYIYVNGKSIADNQVFPGTENWSRWNSITIPNLSLNAGSNTISVNLNSDKGSRNWLNLDELTIR